MTAPLTLDVAALLALPAKVAQLEAELAALREQVARGPARDPDELISVAQAARELDLTPAAVFKIVARAEPPLTKHYPAGCKRRYRLRRGDLLATTKKGTAR